MLLSGGPALVPRAPSGHGLYLWFSRTGAATLAPRVPQIRSGLPAHNTLNPHYGQEVRSRRPHPWSSPVVIVRQIEEEPNLRVLA